MRIAFCGAHRVGKSTLVAELSDLLPDYETVAEPYELLEEEGYEFAAEPSLEDFEAQLEKSIELCAEGGTDVLLERCPLDFLAYLAVHEEASGFDLEDWMPRVSAALATLDLVVFVPVESPDRVAVPASEDTGWRSAVDEKLREILDGQESEVEVLEVEGTVRERAARVLQRIHALMQGA